MQINMVDRRSILKQGASIIGIVSGSSAIIGSAVAKDWDYELVVEVTGAEGEFAAQVPATDHTTEKVDTTFSYDYVAQGNGSLYMDLTVKSYTLSEGVDIVKWDGPGLEDFRVDKIDSDIVVKLNGELIPKNDEYPFR